MYGLGETRNLSSGGVLFVSDTKVDIGEPLEYVINMTEAGGVNLHCLGKVLRIELPLAGSGVPDNMYELAVTLERYEFLRRDF